MADVTWSIAAIGLIIVVGWVARRFGALGPHTTKVGTDVVYWIAAPALLFSVISTADVAEVFGTPLAVAAASGVGSALIFVLIAWLVLRAERSDIVLGAMSASLTNAGYLGIPVSTYVLGSVGHAVPVIVFQLGFFTPMFFVLANLVGSGQRPTVVGVIKGVLTNPLVVAAALGFVCAASGVGVPQVVAMSVEIVGQAAPPLVLIAFGASMVGETFHVRSKRGAIVAWASVGKLVIQPCLACAIGYALGMRGPALMAVTVMAGLPTAQNAFIAAERAHAGQEVTKGVVFVTTIASLPMMVLVVWTFMALGA